MRSFFIQIFLSFWVSTLAIFVAATVLFPRGDYAYRENALGALDTSVQDLARHRLTAAETNHCRDASYESHVLVVNGNGSEVCGQPIPAGLQAILSRVKAAGTRQFGKVGDLWAAAEPVRQAGSETYIAALLSPFQKAPWFPPLPRATLPVSALVTFVFAYFLTNPVRALRKAFREFAAGDLAVRLPVVRSTLRVWGGADVRTLMIDFNEMADRIQALLDAHRTLLRDVSHELRSPLARLNVALELAREEPGEQQEALDRVELESSRLNALIGELLSLSHMETVKDVPQPKRVDLGSLVDDLMPDLLFEADARHCQLIHTRDSEAPVLGSEDVLRRALENVIRNAIRYSPFEGSVEIRTFTAVKHEHCAASVLICDRGPGVPEESLASIFRPFYRVDVSRQMSTGGFGVGLAIAERAVSVHHGAIQARNRAGGGLCVEMSFPCFTRPGK